MRLTHFGNVLVILAHFKGFSKGIVLENCLQNLNGVTDFKVGKLLEMIEDVRYSMRYSKYHFLYTQGAVAFQRPGAFLTHPVEFRTLLQCNVTALMTNFHLQN